MANEIIVKNYHKMYSKLFELDRIQARRFARLTFSQQKIAVEGIIKHLRASQKNDNNPDIHAIREIIDRALEKQRVFDGSSDEII